MTPEQGFKTLVELIRTGKRHKYHKKTVERHETCETLLGNSEAQEEVLRDFNAREDQAQIDARVRLTNSISRAALEPVLSYFQEVKRADGIKGAVESDGTTKAKIESHYSNFYAGRSLLDYCFDRALFASELDPNCWTVFEALFATAANNATSITDIYPVEIESEDVVDYSHDKTGTLQYLAFNLSRTLLYKDKASGKKVDDFYLYGIGFIVHAAQVDPGLMDSRNYDGYSDLEIDAKGSFKVRIFKNGTTEVPAVRWSAYLDKLCDNKIGESLFEASIPILRDLIRDKSFFDVQKVLHIRPEKIQYVKPCRHRDEISGDYCERGYYAGDHNRMCLECGGTGKLTTSGEQDMITMAWPDRAEEIIDLAKITHYVDRPTEILAIYREEINLASTLIFLTTFNQQGVEVESLTSVKTATQSRIEYDKINNKLHPFARLVETAWETAWRVAFQYYGQMPKVVNMSFPLDFKLKDINTLIAEREAAKNAGLPYDIIAGIDADILKKQYRNAPEMILEAQAFERWKPWRSKDAAEVAMILDGRDKSDPARLLYENWDLVVETIKQTREDGMQAPFFTVAPMEQLRLLYETAKALSETIVFTSSAPIMDPLLMDPFNAPANGLQ